MQDIIVVASIPKKSKAIRIWLSIVELQSESKSESESESKPESIFNNNNDNEIESMIKVQSESEPGSFQQYTSGQSIKGKTGEKFADINWKKPKKRLTTKLANINYENELEPQTFQETIYHSIYGKK